ncbi:MAG: D-glycerate dehydrogenase [Candidatus Sungbacteria bacterium]|uniref:D-glycerate dehydrogenase n=1 Tax=Candidatus Sungiibacteriota bacterium TaxID=2750080 RepID=A0A932VQT7_9BACT|nr:D-glycerate dehydrogenase [Candidatus Sungbacteria bacterium]
MKVLITHAIPDRGIGLLRGKGYDVVIGDAFNKAELIAQLAKDRYDAVLCNLNDKIDGEVLDAAGKQCKIFANYAVGFDNIDLASARQRGMAITNTPGVLTDTVAEHAFALMLAIARRIAESDRFTRAGKYRGWEPMLLLGTDVSKKILGIVGLGRIGSRVAHHAARGFDMRVLYYDVKRNDQFEKEFGAEFRANVDDVLRESDFVSIHVPLLPDTHHLIDARRLALMKKSAYLINTSRGPIVDEIALVEALKNSTIRGAALDVFEHEPDLTPGLAELENVIVTPHTASATEETRQAMSELAARNIIEALSGRTPPNLVTQ